MACPFCEEIAVGLPPDLEEVELESREVFRTDRFAVLVDISPLVPGHLLVVPRTHQLSIGSFSDTDRVELRDLLNRIVPLVEQRFGSPALLEHGSDTRADGGGCVSHAHLHIVPGRPDISDALGSWPTSPVASLDALVSWAERDEAYVYVADSTGAGLVAERLDGIPKQFIRIELARRFGIPDPLWDWRRHVLTENLVQTIDVLTPLMRP